jgi:hypothetical protein
MSAGAANLVDHVLPDVPIRQFVVTMPFCERPWEMQVVAPKNLRAVVPGQHWRPGAFCGVIRANAREQ